MTRTTTIQTIQTTTTPFSVSLEDIYIYRERGFVDTLSRRRRRDIKALGREAQLVLDSDIYRHENIIIVAFFFF